MADGSVKLRNPTGSPEHVIPGHDPLVMRRYPRPKPAPEGVAVRFNRGQA